MKFIFPGVAPVVVNRPPSMALICGGALLSAYEQWGEDFERLEFARLALNAARVRGDHVILIARKVGPFLRYRLSYELEITPEGLHFAVWGALGLMPVEVLNL